MINQQSAARNTPSTEQHKLICQLRTTRPLALDWQTTTATESGTTATTNHTAYISPKSLLGGKNTKQCDTGTNACHSLVFPWILSTYYDLRVAQFNKKSNEYFFRCFLCRKCIPCFLVHPSLMPQIMSQTKCMLCAIEHRCVWCYSHVPGLYYMHESANHVGLPELVQCQPRGQGDATNRNV